MELERLTIGIAGLENNGNASSANPLLATNNIDLAQRDPIYYRSKIFMSEIGINPLIAAASPLFSIMERVRNTETVEDLTTLQHDLIHEIKAFENRAQTNGYLSQIVTAARFTLCAWIDEIILETAWGKYLDWEQYRLLNNFQQSNFIPSQQFFLLLNRCSQDPAIYIDLLELIYICLALGYEGEYRHLENGRTDLINIMNNLYLCIRQQRGDFSKQLEISAVTSSATQTKSKAQRIWLGSLLLFAVWLFLLITLYWVLNHELQIKTQMVFQTLQYLLSNTPLT